jgi:hypothetical protein
MQTNVTTIPVWKKYRRASEAVYEADKRKRTLKNWKNTHGIEVPAEKFEAFKANKKFYLLLRQIKEEIDKGLLEAILAGEV